MLRGADQRIGKFLQQLVVGGLAGQRNSVVGGFSAITPSIEDGQYERTLGHEEIPQFHRSFLFQNKCRGNGGGCARRHTSPNRVSIRTLSYRFSFSCCKSVNVALNRCSMPPRVHRSTKLFTMFTGSECDGTGPRARNKMQFHAAVTAIILGAGSASRRIAAERKSR